MNKDDIVKPHQSSNKKDDNKCHRLFYGVDEVTILEPTDDKIIAKLGDKYNIYHKIVLVMKQSTQVYYNMRILLGIKVD